MLQALHHATTANECWLWQVVTADNRATAVLLRQMWPGMVLRHGVALTVNCLLTTMLVSAAGGAMKYAAMSGMWSKPPVVSDSTFYTKSEQMPSIAALTAKLPGVR